MQKKDILVFSIALEGYSSLFKSCLESQKRYCSQWGYKYVLIDKAPHKLMPTQAAWLKLYLLRTALKSGYKWVAFFDADCEIRPHTPSFIQKMSKFDNHKSIFLAYGFTGRINSGVIFLKNTSSSYTYLNEVIENLHREVPPEDKALYENGHMIHYAKGKPSVQIIEHSLWNNNRAYNKESYVQHYSGGILRNNYLENTGQLKKINLLNRVFKKIKHSLFKHNPPYEIEDLNELLPFFLKEYPIFNYKLKG